MDIEDYHLTRFIIILAIELRSSFGVVEWVHVFPTAPSFACILYVRSSWSGSERLGCNGVGYLALGWEALLCEQGSGRRLEGSLNERVAGEDALVVG